MKNIARLNEFGSADRERASLCLVWEAREHLGNAERKEEMTLSLRAHWCAEAAKLLEAAFSLVVRDVDTGPSTVALRLLLRAFSAAKAAVENGQIAAEYHNSVAGGSPSDWDRQREPRSISIFKRSAETARQETHRALAELCELYPDAIPSDEEE